MCDVDIKYTSNPFIRSKIRLYNTKNEVVHMNTLAFIVSAREIFYSSDVDVLAFAVDKHIHGRRAY